MKIAIPAAIMASVTIALFVGSRLSKKSLYTEIEIDAPRDVVWSQLADTGRHPDWNPFIRKFKGVLKVGNRIAVTLQPPGGSPMTFKPKILKADPNEELRWLGKLGVKGVFDGEHYFILEERSDGKTLLRHGEVFSGVLVPILFGLLRTKTRMGFEAMNVALKQRAEAHTG